MSFSAQTCLTYTGTTPLGGTINVYTNLDLVTPLSSVTLTQITSPNCPFIFVVPDGTTSIRLVDTLTLCFVDIPVSSSDLCSVCNFDLSGLTSNPGTISTGPLTASCESNITDYLINWYGPDSPTNLAFTSGKGSVFPYNNVQPFSNILAIGGTYTPVLEKIILSGITFSLTGGSGTVLSNLDCLSPITVEDFTCLNGAYPLPYSQQLSFTSSSNGQSPLGATAKYYISANTQYFAYKFQGFNIYDTLKITLSGSNYGVPIVLENVKIGLNAGALNTSPTTIPKQINDDDYFFKVLCLTGLTINNNDFLLINVTPNSAYTQTNWNLSMQCLDDFDCDRCLDTFSGSPYRIVTQSLKMTLEDLSSGNTSYTSTTYSLSADTSFFSALTGTCSAVTISFDLSGCSRNETNTGDTYDYLFESYNVYINDYSSINSKTFERNTYQSQYPPYNSQLYWDSLSMANHYFYINNYNCQTTNNPITFTKIYNPALSAATYSFDFSDITDYTNFYNNYVTYIQDYNLSYTATTSDVTYNSSYYRRALFLWYYGPDANTNCADNSSLIVYSFHPPTMSATTIGLNITLTQPLLPITTVFSACTLRANKVISDFITSVNYSTSVTPNFNYTSNVGLSPNNPYNVVIEYYSADTVNTGSTLYGFQQFYDYSNLTYPYSGTNTFLPSLSAYTCDSYNKMGLNNGFRYQFPYYYNVRLSNSANTTDFQIWASPISDYTYSGFPSTALYELAYDFSGGSVVYSSSTYCI